MGERERGHSLPWPSAPPPRCTTKKTPPIPPIKPPRLPPRQSTAEITTQNATPTPPNSNPTIKSEDTGGIASTPVPARTLEADRMASSSSVLYTGSDLGYNYTLSEGARSKRSTIKESIKKVYNIQATRDADKGGDTKECITEEDIHAHDGESNMDSLLNKTREATEIPVTAPIPLVLQPVLEQSSSSGSTSKSEGDVKKGRKSSLSMPSNRSNTVASMESATAGAISSDVYRRSKSYTHDYYWGRNSTVTSDVSTSHDGVNVAELSFECEELYAYKRGAKKTITVSLGK